MPYILEFMSVRLRLCTGILTVRVDITAVQSQMDGDARKPQSLEITLCHCAQAINKIPVGRRTGKQAPQRSAVGGPGLAIRITMRVARSYTVPREAVA